VTCTCKLTPTFAPPACEQQQILAVCPLAKPLNFFSPSLPLSISPSLPLSLSPAPPLHRLNDSTYETTTLHSSKSPHNLTMSIGRVGGKRNIA
jgi:hypothetical protein